MEFHAYCILESKDFSLIKKYKFPFFLYIYSNNVRIKFIIIAILWNFTIIFTIYFYDKIIY